MCFCLQRRPCLPHVPLYRLTLLTALACSHAAFKDEDFSGIYDCTGQDSQEGPCRQPAGSGPSAAPTKNGARDVPER